MSIATQINRFNEDNFPFKILGHVQTMNGRRYDMVGPCGMFTSPDLDQLIMIGTYAATAYRIGKGDGVVEYQRALSHLPLP